MCCVLCRALCVCCTWCPYTRNRFERTHGGVWNLHTGGLSLSPLVLHSFSLPSFSSFVLFTLFSSLSLSVTMTMIPRPVGCLCKQCSDLPQCQSAWTSVHLLFGDFVRIMQETTVLVSLCKPRATWNEVGLYPCWKWVLCLVVFGGV